MSEQSEIIFQRLVRVMKTEESVRNMMDLLLTSEVKQDPTMAAVASKLREVILSDLVMKRFLEEMVNILGSHFTPEEAQQILDWNMSPTGQKYSALCPAIALEFQTRLVKYIKPLLDASLKELEDRDEGEDDF